MNRQRVDNFQFIELEKSGVVERRGMKSIGGFMPHVIIKHSVSAACQNDPAEHEPLPDSRME